MPIVRATRGVLALLITALWLGGCSVGVERIAPTVPPSPAPRLAQALATVSQFSGPTPTPLPTLVQPTLGPTSTAILGPTPTLRSATATPTLQISNLGALSVDYFLSDAASARPGDSVTLFWSIKGVDTATIYRVEPGEQRGQSWNVPRTGSLKVEIRSGDTEDVRFMLLAGDTRSQVSETLTIKVGCNLVWFFTPDPGGCPPAPVVTTTLVEQVFERGWMYWVASDRRVYVIFNDRRSPRWAMYPDEFHDGQPEFDASISPPSGFLQPVRGFGLVWRSKEGVRSGLGWASAPEQSYEGQVQGDASAEMGVLYLRTRTGDILALEAGKSAWRLIVPQR